MAYQGGQRGSKRAQKPKWNPTFPGAGFLFGPGAFFAGRGANAATLAPTDAQLRAEGYRPLVEPLRGPLTDAPTDAQLRAEGYRPLVEPLRGPLTDPRPARVLSAGTLAPNTTIVTGLAPGGTVDRSQSDEYRSQLSQYGNLIKQNKPQEAEDLGMKIWMQRYGSTPMAQAGGAVGAYNPLLANMFPETGGYAAGSQPVEEYQMGDLGTRAQGETGYTMESLNPMAAQAAQQAATAQQADKATTVKLPIRNRVQQFLYGGM